MKFQLRNEKDSRFCELIHLVRRSYNTLEQVGRPHDMGNNFIDSYFGNIRAENV